MLKFIIFRKCLKVNKLEAKPAVVAEWFRACVKFKQTLTQRPRFESLLGITMSIAQRQIYFVAIAGCRVTCVAYATHLQLLPHHGELCKGDQFWIQPHIRAHPRATKQGRTKCWRQHHCSVDPTTGRKSRRKAEKNVTKFNTMGICPNLLSSIGPLTQRPSLLTKYEFQLRFRQKSLLAERLLVPLTEYLVYGFPL